MSKQEIVLAVMVFTATIPNFEMIRKYLKSNDECHVKYAAIAPNGKTAFTVKTSNPSLTRVIDAGAVSLPVPKTLSVKKELK